MFEERPRSWPVITGGQRPGSPCYSFANTQSGFHQHGWSRWSGEGSPGSSAGSNLRGCVLGRSGWSSGLRKPHRLPPYPSPHSSPLKLGTPGSQRLPAPASPYLSPAPLSRGLLCACQTPVPVTSALLTLTRILCLSGPPPATSHPKHPRLENWRVSADPPLPGWGVLAVWAS